MSTVPAPPTAPAPDAPPLEAISLVPLDPDRHTPVVHAWLTQERARFWQMTASSEPEVRAYLDQVLADPRQDGWVLTVDGTARAYVETYDPALLIPAATLPPQPGDLGMHLLIGPPDGAPVHGFTARIMQAVVRFCLTDAAAGGLGAHRLVVEPDVRNTAILAKNAAAGFRVLGEIELGTGAHRKRAALSVCTRADLAASPLGEGWTGEASPHAHLDAGIAEAAHRHLLAKALAEFSHERMLAPRPLGEGRYELALPGDAPRYRFRARVLPLEHWLVEEGSISRHDGDRELPLDVLEFVREAQDLLGLPDALASTYLEELASTFAGACAKLHAARAGRRPTAPQLVDADLQQVEAAMTEGHPGFLAGNGRIGYGLADYRAYAPEEGRRTRLVWVAARRALSHLSLGEGLDEQAHLAAALSPEEREAFASRLAARGLDPAAYHLLPLHPWQAEHRLPITFAADIARGDLVPLGPGGDEHQAQQSLRTFYNRTRPGAPYVKVALAIQNMGFLRGLSPHYMRDTPAINDWVAELVRGDAEFAARGFSVLRERAALGYTGDVYHRTRTSNPHRKMLAALWRENPVPLLGPGEQAMTMAALLHRDHTGRSLVGELIRASGLDACTWVASYLDAYLRPLVHALLAHEVVFMPHGENLILRLREHRVVGAFLKDIGEETAVVGRRPLPERIERIRAVCSGPEKALSIQTDVMDGVLRHLSGILEADGLVRADVFWRLVAQTLDAYEADHPRLARGLAGDVDLRGQSFAHSCLNRLQLRNTLQMVDLGNQAESLLYAGEMPNPVARGRQDAAASLPVRESSATADAESEPALGR